MRAGSHSGSTKASFDAVRQRVVILLPVAVGFCARRTCAYDGGQEGKRECGRWGSTLPVWHQSCRCLPVTQKRRVRK